MFEYNGRVYTYAQIENRAIQKGLTIEDYLASNPDIKRVQGDFRPDPTILGADAGSLDMASTSGTGSSGFLNRIVNSPIVGKFVEQIVPMTVRPFIPEGSIAEKGQDLLATGRDVAVVSAATQKAFKEDPTKAFRTIYEEGIKRGTAGAIDTSIEISLDNTKDVEEAIAFPIVSSILGIDDKEQTAAITKNIIKAKDEFFNTGYGKFLELFLPGPSKIFTTSRDEIEEIRKPFKTIAQGKQYENTITEEIGKGINADFDVLVSRIIGDGLTSLPYTLASMNPYTATALGVGIAGDKFVEEVEQNPDQTLFKLYGNAIFTGGIEMADAYLTRRMFSSAGYLTNGMSKKAGESAVKQLNKSVGDKILDVIGIAGKEGLTEIGQAITTRINDYAWLGDYESLKNSNGEVTRQSILKDAYSIIDEGIIGAFSGGGISSVAAVAQSSDVIKDRVEYLMMPASVRKERNALIKEYVERNEEIAKAKKDGNTRRAAALLGLNRKTALKVNELLTKSRLVIDNVTGKDLQEYASNVDSINALADGATNKSTQREIDKLVTRNNEIFEKSLKENYGENISFAEVASKQLGLKTTKAKNTTQFNKLVKKLSGKVIKDSSGVNGVFIGKGQIIINEEVALKLGAVGVGSHEILHPILNAMVGDTQAQQTIVEDFQQTLTRRQRRWTDNEMKRQGKVEGTQEYYKEYINVFSEGLVKKRIGFDLNFGEQVREWLKGLFNGKGFNNIDFRSGRGVYNFMKAYNQSIKDGKLNQDVLSALDVKAVKEAEAIGDGIQKSEVSNEIQDIYEKQGFSGAFDIIEKYEGMANKHAQRFRDVPGFATNKDILVDEILTGRRGVIDLIRAYNPGAGVPLAAYINKYLSSRVIEIANRVLDTNFKTDITEQRNITDTVAEETQETQETGQRQSLRLSLNLTQEVIDKVKDAVVKTFGTRLPDITSKQFKKQLINNYKTFLKPTITDLLGTEQKYKDFLNANFKLIYDIIPQSIINKRFKPFAEPVVDENGKQLRERTAQGNKIFKKKQITKQEFIDYFVGADVKASTKGARKTALSEALAQEIAFDATLDVLRNPDVLEKVKAVAAIQEIDIADNYLSQVASKIERGVDFQFSKEANNAELLYEVRDAILDNTVQQKFPNVYKEILKDPRLFGIKVPKAFKGVTFESFQVKVINDKASEIITANGDGRMGPTGTDITLVLNTKKQGKVSIPVEVKLNGSDQFGSGSIKIDEDGNLSATNKQLGSVLPDIEANLDVYAKMHARAEEIQNETIPFKFPQTGYDLETWQQLKKEFSGKVRNQRIVFTDGAAKIVKFYNNKGINYIYIGNKGLYYMGNNPKKLKVPKFDPESGVYVSLRSSGTRADGKVNLVFRGSNFLVQKGADLNTKDSRLFSDSNFEKDTGMFDFSKEAAELDIEFNDIIEQATGIDATSTISGVQARRKGRRATGGVMNMFIPYGAEDFQGLMYQLLPKGKQGDKAFAWMKNNLFRPFGIANANIDNERAVLMSKWKDLKKKLNNVPKQLSKKTPDGDFTFEDAVRVYIWNKQGMDIPGLTESDNKMLNKYVLENKDLKDFARQLLIINGASGYTKPSAGWDAGNISLDLQIGLQTNVRERHLKQWQENVDIIFSPDNLNKLEAAFGPRYIEALNNILLRMKRGTNRLQTGNRQVDNWLIWLNASVGNIMFLNRRSSLLQLISNVNYINWSDNNLLKAGQAFANQPQYWKDFITIFNSDYLQNRRGGNRINVNENEIAEMANKGGVQGAISYLLDKGFILTRIADSFAIASGGAGFYRNRIKTYEKQGLSEQEAQQKAFTDFREITEESQQASRPDRISMEQASGLGRVILAFANTPMQYNRLMKRAIQDLANGRGDWKTNMSKIGYYGFVQNFIFNAMQQALVAMGFDDDVDDERQKEKLNDVGSNMVDSILRGQGAKGNVLMIIKNMVRDVIRKSELPNPKYFEVADNIFDVSPPASSKYKKLRAAGYTFSYEMKKIKSEGLSFENPANMALANIAAAATNIPFDRLVRTIDDARYLSKADVEYWQKIMIALGWPAWQIGVDLNEKDENKRVKKVKKLTKKRTQKRRL